MNTGWRVGGLVLALMGAGCCTQQGLVQRVNESLTEVQRFYNPMVSNILEMAPLLHQAVVAADTSLMLAGELQHRWCPNPHQAKQLELSVEEARKLAQEAGVVAANTLIEPQIVAPVR